MELLPDEKKDERGQSDDDAQNDIFSRKAEAGEGRGRG
jgi:hypothetical protein